MSHSDPTGALIMGFGGGLWAFFKGFKVFRQYKIVAAHPCIFAASRWGSCPSTVGPNRTNRSSALSAARLVAFIKSKLTAGKHATGLDSGVTTVPMAMASSSFFTMKQEKS